MLKQFWNWLQSMMESYGFNPLGKKASILFLGLDGAGKTTLLFLLKENRFIQASPTQHGTSDELILDNLTFTTYDLGGHRQVRKVWSEYMPIVDGIVFMIDATKRDRFDEAKSELDAVLGHEETQSCPILILANKIDSYKSASETEIIQYFNLGQIMTGKEPNASCGDRRPLELFMTSLKNRQGYGDGFRWLAKRF